MQRTITLISPLASRNVLATDLIATIQHTANSWCGTLTVGALVPVAAGCGYTIHSETDQAAIEITKISQVNGTDQLVEFNGTSELIS